ncbi:MAG: hypothetical protein ISN29_11410 [Gammaproteobacteria bacterium AqS3]|nr:hypothetical protein [Gammaproteobacteria bacterium AqS3]
MSTSSLTISEGGSKTFTVKLGNWPGNNRTINLTRSGSSDVTVNKTSLTFTASNWNAVQTVTVRAAHDTDKLDDTATISLTGTGIVSSSVNVTVIDDDRTEFVLSPTSLKVSEGRTNTFTVKLAKNPGGTRTVTLASNNAEVTVDAQSAVFGKQNSLTFTSSNWNQTQTVTVYAAHDDDKVDDTATINLTGTDITAGSVEVTVLDDDVGLRWSGFPSTIQEGGSENFNVRLDKWPGNNRTISLSSSNSDVTFDANPDEAGNQTAMTLRASNWNTGQTVTIRAAHDADKTNDSAGIYLTMSESGFSYWLQLTVIDDDVAVELTLSKSTLTINEGGNKTFTVKLATQPSANVTVKLVRSGDTDVTVSKTSLSFTTSNWNTTQSVTVRAAQDDDSTDDIATISLTASGGDYAGQTGSISVSVTDDDEADLMPSTSSLTINEGGSKSFTVRLAAQPSANVTVTLVRSGDTDVTVNKTSLSFTTSNWSTAQSVTVRAAQDSDKTDDSATINLTATGGLRSASVAVTVYDDDDFELVLSKESLRMLEGKHDVFGVKLSKQPIANVTVTVGRSSTTHLSVNKSTLTFTTSNWSVSQSIRVDTSPDLNFITENETISLTASIRGHNSMSVSVAVEILDGDILEVAGVSNSTTTWMSVGEGASISFSVRLKARPPENEILDLAWAQGDPTSAVAHLRFDTDSETAGNQDTLTFTTSNWHKAQTVTVSADNHSDHIDRRGQLGGFYLSNVLGRNRSTWKNVYVRVFDKDIGLAPSVTSLKMDEGGVKTFTVKMDSAIWYDRKITLTSTNDDVTISPTALTFTGGSNSNWNTARTVTVRAAEDGDAVDDTATIGFEVRMPSNNNLVVTATDTVTVTVRDDDAGAAGLSISAIAPEAGDGRLAGLLSGGDDVMSGLWSGGDGAVLGLGELGSGVGSGHRVAGLGFSNGEMSVSTGNANLYFAQLEHRKNWSNHDGSGQQFGRRRPENQPHHIPRDRHVNLGFEHR